MKSDELLAYYFGTVTAEQRVVIEERFLASPPQLLEFFALKRSFEEQPELRLEPSAALKARLRAEVAATVGRPGVVRLFQELFSTRKAWAAAGAVAAAVLVLVIGQKDHPDTVKSEAGVETSAAAPIAVDAANSIAVNLSYL